MLVVYGIKNCDTVKKARRWLDEHGVAYRFHDLRADGLDEPMLRTWCDAVGWDVLLNRKGTTWRKLSEAERTNLGEKRAMYLMLMQPTLIKRPVVKHGGVVLVGFDTAEYAARLTR